MPHLSRRTAAIFFGLCCLIPVTAARGAGAEEGRVKPAFISLGEFTVNLPSSGEALSYVVIGLTIDANPEGANALKDITPRLKEAIIRRLMVLAERGALQPGRTDTAMLKTSLIDSLNRLSPDSVRDILITRLLYG